MAKIVSHCNTINKDMIKYFKVLQNLFQIVSDISKYNSYFKLQEWRGWTFLKYILHLSSMLSTFEFYSFRQCIKENIPNHGCLRPTQMHPTFHPTFNIRVGWNFGRNFGCWMKPDILIRILLSGMFHSTF